MRKIIPVLIAGFLFAIEIDVEDLIKKVKNDPYDVKNRLVIASYFIKKGKIKKAKTYLNQALKIDPKNPYALKLKKIMQSTLLKGQKEDVNTTQNRKRVKQNPAFEYVKNFILSLYGKNPKKATELAKKYAISHPKNIKAQIFYARLLIWQNRLQEAVNFLSKIQNLPPDGKLLLGKALSWIGEYQKALKYLNDVKRNKKERYEALKAIGFIYAWEGEKKKAKEIFTRLYKENPKDEEVKEELMVLQGKIRPLIKKYLRLLKKEPKNTQYILKLANYYELLKEYQKAIYFYKKYLRLKPDIEIYKNLGDLYLNIKNYYKGFGYFEYYANYKNTKEAYYQLALRYYWYGFNEAALQILNQLLQEYPTYKKAAKLRAEILKYSPTYTFYQQKNQNKELKTLAYRAYNGGFYESATEYYKEYLLFYPNDYEAREGYAYALEKAKLYSKAAGEFYLLMWYKKDLKTEYHLAYNLQKSGDIKRAKEIYTKILKNLPKQPPSFIKEFLYKWKSAWESMDINRYSKFYAKKLSQNPYWRRSKERVFKKSGFISVKIYDPVVIYHKDKIYKVKFYQIYASKTVKDKGYKILTLKCDNKRCKIVKEVWYKSNYDPSFIELEKTIKERLNEIKTETKKTLPKTEKTAKNLKKFFQTPKKKSKPKQKTAKTPHLPKTDKYALYTDLYHFKDNQNTKLSTLYLKASKTLNNITLFTFLKSYTLNNSKKGGYYGIGAEKTPFLFDIFKEDNSKIGWDFYYSKNGYTFKINRHSLVYSKKTVCAANHTRIKAEISKYTRIDSSRGLWWSLAEEVTDDKNSILTPQIEYEFFSFTAKNTPFTTFFSGWYQFNSKTTPCYYSPKKADNNLIGVRVKNFFKIKNSLSIAKGYSFFENANLYQIKYTLDYPKKASAALTLSNSSKISSSSDYKGIEFELSVKLKW